MHADIGLREVLRQILAQMGWAFQESHARRVDGGFQADITLFSSTNIEKIYGETLPRLSLATESALIFALDHVDRFWGVDFIDVFHG